MLSGKLKTHVKVDEVKLDLLNHILLKGVFIEDEYKDTLLYAGKLQVKITDLLFSRKQPVFHYIELQNTYIHLYRPFTSSVWNYAFLADLFGNDKNNSKSQFKFELKTISLENVRFYIDDQWVGWNTDYEVGNLDINAKKLDFDKHILDIEDIVLKKGYVFISSYAGGRPVQVNTINDTSIVTSFDNTPFNPDKWQLKSKTIKLYDCKFGLSFDSNIPKPNEFDYGHIDISNIQVNIENGRIIGDTIFGNLLHLQAHERCGLNIKSMHSKITVSPIASICDNLYFETDNSKIKNYYAMHYKHFPSFLNYIDSVTMVGRLKDAIVDKRDIAFFASVLDSFPDILLHITGEGKGTVSNLSGKNLYLTDGISTIKGSGSIVGLPDIYKSKINFPECDITTTGAGIIKYAKVLKDNPNIAIDKITNAHFFGSYQGYIDSFAVKGFMNTNLGSVTTNICLNIKQFVPDSAKYEGNVSTDKFDIGSLFNMKDVFGLVTLNENVNGFSFNTDVAQIKLDGVISEFDIKGYTYHNILVNGTLAKKQFNGNLMVVDSNLALQFNGILDYSNAKINILAKANLLGCDLKKLHFTDDVFTLSADFDLNCVGNNIDNFSGYARLDNIDIKRNNHKLDLDSVYLKSSGDTIDRTLIIQSNALFAKIKGNYKLSKLPLSFQYYLSKYLPSYFKIPETKSPEQNFEFIISTTNIDSLLAISIPTFRGFENSYISGIVNTTTQDLKFVANIPYGSIKNVRMNNIAVSCDGNVNSVNVFSTIENVAFSDSSIKSSIILSAKLQSGSVDFNINATTPDSMSSVQLNGQVISQSDTLFLSLQPSSINFNKIKWDISNNGNIIYSDKYLIVDKLNLSSGLQKISTSYGLNGQDQTITVNVENIDLAQLGTLAKMSYYQPDGRVNGTIKLINILNKPYISANLLASNFKLGTDTIGTVNIIGYYDIFKKFVYIDPQTGIINNNTLIKAEGQFTIAENSIEKIDGKIQVQNMPISFASPFVSGIFSNLTGGATGTIEVSGNSSSPNIRGSINVKNVGFHLDYMGCSYKIPSATVNIDKDKIDLGKFKIEDNYKNTGNVSGYFYHNFFKDMRMQIVVQSDRMEVMRLSKTDNNYFYGNVVAGMDSFTVTGPFNDISLNAYNVYPAAKSHIYIPVATTGDSGTYSYISFKTYGKVIPKIVRKNQTKININIDANLNELADITILLDPVTGDAIDAQGSGNVQLKMPANNDMRITGSYNIESGTYTFTFKQLEYKKQFKLNSGSTIYFKGPFASTSLDVYAVYTAKARLFDLLNSSEQASLSIESGSNATGGSTTSNSNDLIDAKRIQPVEIVLHMEEALFNPKLSFNLNVEDKSMEGNPAYTKLQQINADDRQKFDQVASLLLTGNFLSQDGLFGNSSLKTGTLNNFSQMLSGTASSTLTNIVNKLIGERKVNINVNYQNYNYSDVGVSNISRNKFSGTISKNYLNDRLIVEIGGKSDWGHLANANAGSSYNIAQDVRIQYLLSRTGNFRINCFSTGDYDVTLERQINRNGIGISWKKSFDKIDDFFKKNKPNASLNINNHK